MLSTQPWEDMLKMNASDAADFLEQTIQESAEHCIPRRELRERKSTHPWLTAEPKILVKETTMTRKARRLSEKQLKSTIPGSLQASLITHANAQSDSAAYFL